MCIRFWTYTWHMMLTDAHLQLINNVGRYICITLCWDVVCAKKEFWHVYNLWYVNLFISLKNITSVQFMMWSSAMCKLINKSGIISLYISSHQLSWEIMSTTDSFVGNNWIHVHTIYTIAIHLHNVFALYVPWYLFYLSTCPIIFLYVFENLTRQVVYVL